MSVLETARALLATGSLCDSCLGRPFAHRSHGLTNTARGEALRIAIALEDDSPAESVSIEECWVCAGYSGTVDAIATTVTSLLADIDFATYQVGSRIAPLIEENDRLLREEADLEPDVGEAMKREINREVGRRVGARTETTVSFERPDVLCVVDLDAFDPGPVLEGEPVTSHAVDVQVNPAFVFGRYRKLERDIPQTEWPCRDCGGSGRQLGEEGEEPCSGCGGTGYRYPTSVEQLVRPPIVDAMAGDEGTFHGAGREDVDARMLGDGRPFVLEVTEPRRRRPPLPPVESAINETADGAIEVEGLRLATHDMVERVKELEASKRYRGAVEFEESVTEETFESALETLDGATIEQRTPERVDHRRAMRTRTRTVYACEGTLDSPTTATIEIHGAGGLYVKELVSGDGGRTEPSLAGLLETGATMVSLDVLAVTGEDEPFEDDAYFLE